MGIRRGTLAMIIGLGSLLASAPAAAHPLVDEARERFEAADFAGALTSLARAEDSTDLSRPEYLSLLELRVLVQQALGDDGAIDQALLALASLDPEYEFGPEVSPDLKDKFRRQVAEQQGRTVGVETAVARGESAVTLRGEAVNDPADIVREVRVHARPDGAAWASGPAQMEIDTAGVSSVEFYAQAIGPGGTLLANRGSEQSPLRVDVSGPELVIDTPEQSNQDDTDDGGVPWLWVGVGGGVAAALIVFAVLAAGSGDDERLTQPSAPMVEFNSP